MTASPTPSREAILAALGRVAVPGGGDLVSRDLVRALVVDHGAVRFVIEAESPEAARALEPARIAAERAVAGLPGVEKVAVAMTAHGPAPRQAAGGPAGRDEPPALTIGRHPTPGPSDVPGVKRIIAVGSGKGGVGKSTVSVNLAVALAREGWKVGLVDADIYGPSLPRMLGVSKRPASPDGKTIIPPVAHGVRMISIGLMLPEEQALIWRGPMLMGALQQMMTLVQWGELDVLVIDLPPGTGDVQLTLAQKFVVDGAIIVSTPQDVALIDARKGIDMFRRMNIPILGMIENMSTHVCSNCGHEEHVFGHGGVVSEAKKLDVPLLAEVPLHLDIRTAGDGGAPVVVNQPDSPQAAAFIKVARELVGQGVA